MWFPSWSIGLLSFRGEQCVAASRPGPNFRDRQTRRSDAVVVDGASIFALVFASAWDAGVLSAESALVTACLKVRTLSPVNPYTRRREHDRP